MSKSAAQTMNVAVRNPMAGALAQACFQNRVVRARKGKGSYSRKAKHSARAYA